MKIQRTPIREGPCQGKSTLVCSSIGRPARTPSITIEMKEEQQIRVRTEFGVERGRIRVGDRTSVEEFWFILIGLVALNWA
jgi:hypothetical protein